MCGIAGFFGSDSAPQEYPHVLGRMSDSLAHRGPDEEGFLTVGDLGAGLACRRLSIIDIETGRQPVSNEDGSVHVVLNGEIYNHRELRAALEQRGHRFSTQSDTEVIVHLFEDEGVECFSRLAGMFAAAILDVRNKRLILARDRCGMKPLYYAQSPHGFSFASEIKALRAGGRTLRPDFDAIDAYFSQGYLAAPNTCFEGVEKLPPGHFAVVEEGRFERQAFWRFRFDHSEPERGDQEYADELDSRLQAAVKSHLAADVPVGLLLSGGWDSSLLAAYAAGLVNRPLQTFSALFPEAPEADESRYQRLMAESIGSEHFEVEFRWREIPSLIQKAAYHLDVPSIAYPSLVHYKLASLASAHVKTVLSGEGSDELFAGYHWYRDFPGYSLRPLLPKRVQRIVANRAPEGRWGRLLRVLSAPDDESADAEMARLFSEQEKRALMQTGGSQVRRNLFPQRADPETLASCDSRLERLLARSFTRSLPDGLLMVNDRISMARSLEVRMPFLDNSIVDLARRLPASMKRRGEQEKYILSLLKCRLPPEIASRKKSSMRTPLARYFRGPLRAYARELLLDSKSSPLNKAYIERRFDRWMDGPDPYVLKIRTLVCFQAWWNEFFGSDG